MRQTLRHTTRVCALGLLLLTALGCPGVLLPQAVTKRLTLPDTPDAAYQKATQALIKMGGSLTLANPQQRVLSATVKNAVVLNVTIAAAAEGSVVEASGKVLPDKLAFGPLDEVDTYLSLVREQR